MSKFKCILTALLGVVLIVLSIVMYVHDGEYIFTGNTVDLNEIIESGEEMPRDKFVTYTIEYPLGNYAETRETIAGFIPIPFGKTQQYAILCEDGKIISAEVGKKAKITELEQAVEAFYNDEPSTVTIIGNLQTNDPEMNTYLAEFADYLFEGDLESAGVTTTYFVIDTTKTRLSQFFLYFFFLLLGAAITAVGIRNLRRCI